MTEITLFKPNELISAIDQIQVNRTAKHLCNYFLQYAQQQIKFNNHTSNKFELTISRLNEEAQIGLKDYKLIGRSLDALMQPVTIRPKDDPKKFIKLVPIYLVAVDTEAGLYRYNLAPEVLEILKASDYFTKLNLHEFNFLQSKHSIVIYEWLKRYEHAPKIPQISIDELRQITHTSDKKTYDNFTNLKRAVIDIAVTEITDKTPYAVTYTAIKTRAKTRDKVTAIQFEFKRKSLNAEQQHIQTQQPEPKPAPQPQIKQQSVTNAPETLEELLSPSLHIYTTDEAGNQIDIDAMYSDLADQFIAYGFPTEAKTTATAKRAECYEAFWNFKHENLKQFFERTKNYPTKNKFNWLREKSTKGYHARQQFHFEYFARLRSDALTKSGMSQTEFEKLIVTAESQIGFASLLERLRRYLGETNPVKLLNYL